MEIEVSNSRHYDSRHEMEIDLFPPGCYDGNRFISGERWKEMMLEVGQTVDLTRKISGQDRIDSYLQPHRQSYIYGLLSGEGFGYVGCSLYPSKRYWELEKQANDLGSWIKKEMPNMIILDIVGIDDQSKSVRRWARYLKVVLHKRRNGHGDVEGL